MKVYVVKHDVYSAQDENYESFVEVFNSKESAITYFEIKKETVIEEFLDYTHYETFERLIINQDVYCDQEPNAYDMPYFYLDLHDFGYDRIVIQEKDIMKF